MLQVRCTVRTSDESRGEKKARGEHARAGRVSVTPINTPTIGTPRITETPRNNLTRTHDHTQCTYSVRLEAAHGYRDTRAC